MHAKGRLLVGEMGRQKVRIFAWVAAPMPPLGTLALLAAATKAKGPPGHQCWGHWMKECPLHKSPWLCPQHRWLCCLSLALCGKPNAQRSSIRKAATTTPPSYQPVYKACTKFEEFLYYFSYIYLFSLAADGYYELWCRGRRGRGSAFRGINGKFADYSFKLPV